MIKLKNNNMFDIIAGGSEPSIYMREEGGTSAMVIVHPDWTKNCKECQIN